MQHGLRRPEARAVLALAPTPRQAAALSKRRLRDLFAAPRLRQRPDTEQAMGARTRLHLAELSLAETTQDTSVAK